MGVPISSLPASSTLTGTESLPVVQSGTTKKTTVADVLAALPSNAITTAKIADANVTPAKLANSGYELGMRNRIINGDMRIDQRNSGAGVTVSAGTVTYTLDRWAVYSTGASCFAQQVAGQNSYDKAIQLLPAAGNTGTTLLQRIEAENCADIAGKTVTVSGKIYINNSSGVSCSISALAATSTDSNYVTSITGFSVSLTSDWIYFSGQLAFPSSAGNGVELDISFSGVSGKTVSIAEIQLEKGSTATPFEYRPYGTELAMCQRYYEKIYVPNAQPFATLQAVSGAVAYGGFTTFKVTKRANPTVSYSGTVVPWVAGGGSAGGSVLPYGIWADGLNWNVTSASGLSAGNAVQIVSSGGAVVINASAEL